jgi:hypothetical protein
MRGDPKFEIATAYPMLHEYYGWLVGFAFTLPYSVAGLYAGSLAKTGNRKLLMVATITLLSTF